MAINWKETTMTMMAIAAMTMTLPGCQGRSSVGANETLSSPTSITREYGPKDEHPYPLKTLVAQDALKDLTPLPSPEVSLSPLVVAEPTATAESPKATPTAVVEISINIGEGILNRLNEATEKDVQEKIDLAKNSGWVDGSYETVLDRQRLILVDTNTSTGEVMVEHEFFYSPFGYGWLDNQALHGQEPSLRVYNQEWQKIVTLPNPTELIREKFPHLLPSLYYSADYGTAGEFYRNALIVVNKETGQPIAHFSLKALMEGKPPEETIIPISTPTPEPTPTPIERPKPTPTPDAASYVRFVRITNPELEKQGMESFSEQEKTFLQEVIRDVAKYNPDWDEVKNYNLQFVNRNNIDKDLIESDEKYFIYVNNVFFDYYGIKFYGSPESAKFYSEESLRLIKISRVSHEMRHKWQRRHWSPQEFADVKASERDAVAYEIEVIKSILQKNPTLPLEIQNELKDYQAGSQWTVDNYY